MSRTVKKTKDLVPFTGDVATQVEGHRAMLKVSVLAGYLDVTPKSLYARIRSGTLPALRIGASIRLDPATTAKWLRARSA